MFRNLFYFAMRIDAFLKLFLELYSKTGTPLDQRELSGVIDESKSNKFTSTEED
jgi:hypothetical protein